MIALSQAKTKRLLAVHGWSGTLLGLILYVVVLTGTLAVFAQEIGSWSVGGAKASQPLAVRLDAPLRALAQNEASEYLEGVDILSNTAGDIVAFFYKRTLDDAGEPDNTGIMFEIDPRTLAVVSQRVGLRSDLFDKNPSAALTHFLVDLHVRLHLPEPWGLYFTGVIGMLMLAAAVSGFLMHRHLIADIFIAPRSSSRLLHARDRHVLAGSWGLPFAVVLALTGSFLSFAVSLGLPLVSATAFGGDRAAMIETLVGLPDNENPTRLPLANLDAITAQSMKLAGSAPNSMIISNWGRADARIEISHPPAEGTIQDVTLAFSGSDGLFIGEKLDLGTAPSVGNTILGLMFALHFGNFAGTASKVVWFALGLASCFVILSGLQLWLQRRNGNPLWQRLARAVPTVGYGLPFSISVACVAFFLSLPSAQSLFWTPVGFLVAASLVVLSGVIISDERRLRGLQCFSLGLALLLLPLARMGTGGTDWAILASNGNWGVIAFDSTFLLAGVSFIFRAVNSARIQDPSKIREDRG